jgi:hypothetical protein
MPESLDLRAAGVASLLKSLRQRGGLEERLAATELDVDALAGLESVRARMPVGTPAEEAIVATVRAATGSLAPTLSIVADVILRLKLSDESVFDPPLYGPSLMDRRKALLANWDLLHNQRSVSPAPPVPKSGYLRLDLEAEALGALARALTAPAGVMLSAGMGPAESRPAVVPADVPESVRDLGRDMTVAETTGAPSWQDPASTFAGLQAPTTLHALTSVARALRNRLIRASSGEPQGWPHELRAPGGPVPQPAATALATAYGLKSMVLLEGHLSPDLAPIVPSLRAMQAEGGGYATRAQSTARPEVTATVLDALHRVDGTADLTSQLQAMEKGIGEFEKSRPYILSTLLETSVALQPDAMMTSSLIKYLLAARRQYPPYSLWPEKAEPHLANPGPSTVHTARAIRALAMVHAVRPDVPGVLDAIEQAKAWLDEHANLTAVSEIIVRPLDETIESLPFRHFTAAWVVKALVAAGLPGSSPLVSAAVAEIWESYHGPSGLWKWQNGDTPIWMTFDAIEALQSAALAAIIPIARFTELRREDQFHGNRDR